MRSASQSRRQAWLPSVWLILLPFLLWGSCFFALFVRFITFATVQNGIDNVLVGQRDDILLALVAGCCTAVALTVLWHSRFGGIDPWWLIGNIVLMSSGMYANISLVYSLFSHDYMLYSLDWLLPTVLIGVSISFAQGLILRLRRHFTVWWIAMMSVAWFAVWLAISIIIWSLGD